MTKDTKGVRELLRLTASNYQNDPTSHSRSISVLESCVAALCNVIDAQNETIEDLAVKLGHYEKVLGAPSDVLDAIKRLRKAFGK